MKLNELACTVKITGKPIDSDFSEEEIKSLTYTKPEGKDVVLVGPNGAGKTFLLKRIAGAIGEILKQDKGNKDLMKERNLDDIIMGFGYFFGKISFDELEKGEVTYISPDTENVIGFGSLSLTGNKSYDLAAQYFNSNDSGTDVRKTMISDANRKKLGVFLEICKDYLSDFNIAPNSTYNDLSQGQKRLLTILSNIIAGHTLETSSENNLLILDEPEKSLSGPMQRKLINIIKNLQNVMNYQLIIATRSTEIMKVFEKDQFINLAESEEDIAYYNDLIETYAKK